VNSNLWPRRLKALSQRNIFGIAKQLAEKLNVALIWVAQRFSAAVTALLHCCECGFSR
jgi:hypothetical protein